MKRNGSFKSLIGLMLLLVVGCRERPPTTIQVTRIITREVVITRIVPGVGETQSCTLLGCQDRLTVGLTGDWPDSFSIDIVYAMSGESMQVARRCVNGRWAANDQPCNEIQLETGPNIVTITARWEDNSISQVYEPVYEQFQPNGPACEPVCLAGTITFDFPE